MMKKQHPYINHKLSSNEDLYLSCQLGKNHPNYRESISPALYSINLCIELFRGLNEKHHLLNSFKTQFFKYIQQLY